MKTNQIGLLRHHNKYCLCFISKNSSDSSGKLLFRRLNQYLGVPRVFSISILCSQALNLKKFPIEISYSIRVLKTEILKSSVDLPTSGLQILWLSVINFVKIIFRFWLRLNGWVLSTYAWKWKIIIRVHWLWKSLHKRIFYEEISRSNLSKLKYQIWYCWDA